MPSGPIIIDMDSLDVEAMEERAGKLEDATNQARFDILEEYIEVLNIAWEAEFRPMMLRTRAFTAKLPPPVRISFVRGLIREVIASLTPIEIAGVFATILDAVFVKSRMQFPPPMTLLRQLQVAPPEDKSGTVV